MDSEEFEHSFFHSSIIDDRYIKKEISYNEHFFIDKEYETFKLFLNKLNWLKDYKIPKLLENDIKYTQGPEEIILFGRYT